MFLIVMKKKVEEIFAVISMLLAVLFCSLKPLPPADLWWQLSLGRYISTVGAVLKTNIFSYAAANFPVTDHEWLAELIFYKLYSIGGLGLLYIFKSCLILGSFLFIYLIVRRRGVQPWIAAVALTIAAFCAHLDYFGDIRPYIFTYFFFALTLYLLDSRKGAFCLLPILWIWANTHAGYILFFILLILSLLIKCVAFISKSEGTGLQKFSKCISSEKLKLATLLLAPFIVLLNPYGVKLLLYPFSFTLGTVFKQNINEWAPPHLFSHELYFLIYFIFVTLLTVLSFKQLKPFEWILLLFFSILPFTAVRHITLYSFVGAYISACALNSLIKKWNLKYLPIAIPCCLILLFSFLISFNANNYNPAHLSMERKLFPYYAVDFILKNHLKGNIFHQYGWGGYLLWKLYPNDPEQYKVFIDGRANVAYSEEQYRESLYLDFGYPVWEQLLNKYKVNTVLCSKRHMLLNRYKNRSLADQLQSSKNWKLVYEDSTSLIFLKVNKLNRAILNAKFYCPESPYSICKQASELFELGRYSLALNLLLDRIDMDPYDPSIPMKIAEFSYYLGDKKLSLSMVNEGLRRDPENRAIQEIKKKLLK